jgi:hypothetical protein
MKWCFLIHYDQDYPDWKSHSHWWSLSWRWISLNSQKGEFVRMLLLYESKEVSFNVFWHLTNETIFLIKYKSWIRFWLQSTPKNLNLFSLNLWKLLNSFRKKSFLFMKMINWIWFRQFPVGQSQDFHIFS